MPFDPVVFRTRALTALVFAAVMLAGLLWNGWSFFLLFTVVHFGCWQEYGRLTCLIHPEAREGIDAHLMTFGMMGWCGMILASAGLLGNAVEAETMGRIARMSLAVLAATVAYRHFFGGRRLSSVALRVLLIGVAYLSIPWVMLLHIRSGAPWMPGGDGPHFARDIAAAMGQTLPLVIIASIWLNDTLAYLTGSFLGRTPLSHISPKKTWEGTIGGVVLSVALVTLVGHYGLGGDTMLYGSISFLSSVAGTVGDLLESWLKRRAGVKDSGSFMPGHGGFLDRFDSLLLAVPAVWVYCMLVAG
ncbi:MAG: phosphatidate cytidylyltransferase [Chitinophagia bacterium]|nr:phosphatidate cytidylyltransferase [Chitinophagia bacterium]